LHLVLWEENTGWMGLGIEPREAAIATAKGLCKCWEVMSTDGLGVERKQSACMPVHNLAADENQEKCLVLPSSGNHD
jgi:hypothetical protein